MRHILLLILFFSLQSEASAVAVDTTSGRTAPAKESGELQSLVNYLCDIMAVDTVKANIIYNWITSNIEYDIKAAKDPDRPTPTVENILKDKKATAEGYTLLFQEMCKAVGLQAVVVQGYAKDWMFDNGDKLYLPGHEWCAVMIGRRWELVDPLMGAGGVTRAPGWFRSQFGFLGKDKIQYYKREVFEFNYNPKFFLMDPLEFRYTHLPADPLWQLCKTDMPLNVFEAGDSAIAYYNGENPGRINRSPELEYMARLNPDQMLVEYADRAYKFNRRFDMILAMKEQVKTRELLHKHASRRSTPPKRSYEEAYKNITQAEEHLKKQKGYLASHYAGLKKKNSQKNRYANSHIRKIKTHNKSLASKSKRQASTAERKIRLLDKKQERAEYLLEHISPLRIDSIKTTSLQKEKTDPMLMALVDSINAKEGRLKKWNMQAVDRIQNLTVLQEENKTLLESLVQNHLWSDTILIFEAVSRAHFHDNKDDDIRMYMAAFNKSRFVLGDTMQNRYLRNFDTLAARYDDLLDIYKQQAALYKTTLRDMEQYRRQNNTEEFILTSYATACNGYVQCMSQYTQTMSVYEKFLEDNNKTFTELAERYESEEDILERMEEAETARKEAEEVAQNENKAFEERQIEMQLQTVKAMQEQLINILSE